MSVGDRWWDPNAAATPDAGTTDAGLGTPIGADPADDPTKNEYYAQRLQTPPWITAGFPDYASYAANLRLKEDLARQQQERAINAPTNAAGVSASISTTGANQRAAAQAEIDKAKNAADEAHNAGLLALQNGNAAEARRQFDISQQELQRYHSADIALRQQEQNLASSKFGNDVYNKLTDLASNPRNFMEQFFRMRGQPAPAGSAQYGNTSVTGPGLATFEQFLPNFLRATGLGGGATPSSGVSTSAAPGPTTNQYGSTQNNPANPYAGTNVNYGGSPTTADTANISGVPTWAGGAYSGKSVASSPANAGDLTPYLKNPSLADPTGRVQQGISYDVSGVAPSANVAPDQKPKFLSNGVPIYGHGGSVHMTAPHALVNLLSGKVAAIAGEAGPETAKFNGAAIIDPKEGLAPVAPDGSADGGFTPNAPYTVNPTQTATAASDLGTPAVLGQTVPGVIPANAPQTWTPEDLAAMIAAANAGNAASQPATTTGTSAPDTYVNQPGPPPLLPITPLPQLPAVPIIPPPPPVDLGAMTGQNPIAPPPPPPPPAPFQLPNLPGVGPGSIDTSINPQNIYYPGRTAPGDLSINPQNTVYPGRVDPGTLTFDQPPVVGQPPIDLSGGAFPPASINPQNTYYPATLGKSIFDQTPSGIGKNPQFLPENLAAEDPIIAEMLKQGAFPPFLQRLFAQNRGLSGLGTNVPQSTDLPPGVPLVSKLAYGQMTPSEQQAFVSFISAHGLSPEDYFSMVEAASPQGGSSSKNPAIPAFLRQ